MINKIRNLCKKYVDPIFPLYAVWPLVCCFLVNTLVYEGTKLFTMDSYFYDFTTDFDRMVPVIPEFIVIYIISFVFWFANNIMAARESRENCFRFVCADITTRLICAVFYLFLPTTNVRPTDLGTGFCAWALGAIYWGDPAKQLFPSIHCIFAWLVFAGIRKSKVIPKWYKVFSFVFAIVICISTQVTKQHYIVDVFAGIFVAESCWQIFSRINFYKKVMPFFDKVSCFIFGKENVKLSDK